MSNCKQCNKPIESNTGRRPREYCNAKCRMDYFNKNKTTKVWKSTHEAVLKEKEEVVKENAALKDLVAELQKNNPIFDRQNKFTNTARGRDESGVNNDEVKTKGKKIKTDKAGKVIPKQEKMPVVKKYADMLDGESLLDYKIRISEQKQS